MTPASRRALAWAALAALPVLVAYWFAAWSSVRVLLADDEAARRAAWASGATPWRWSFDRPEAVVWPGSTGFERDASQPTFTGSIPDGNADLSLDLRGESIPFEAVDGARVELAVSHPTRVSLLAGGGFGTEVAAIDVPPPGGVASLSGTASHGLATTDVLRLHLETAPGAQVTLHRVSLSPRAGVRPQPCASTPCRAAVPRVIAPDFRFPESLLAWRDGVLRDAPAAIVELSTGAPVKQAVLGGAGNTDAVASSNTDAAARDDRGPVNRTRAFAHDVRRAMGAGAWAWVLALTPVFVGLMSRLRTGETSRATALLELALVFSPWLLLQWSGWPADDGTPGAAWVFVGALVGALMLRPIEPAQLVGNRYAWRAAFGFLAVTAVVIGALALANAFDADGFAPRPVSATKAWQYPLWALVQQAILLRAIAPRLRLATRDEALGAVCAGALFGALHVPNFALMGLTFVAGTAWAAIGRRHPALLPLAVAHGIAGLAVVWAAPTWWLRSAEVGARYLMAP